ncbi:polysaccharide pyruvyl transferase family protein [Rarobacter faecitabidus]|uniref:Polysaccharide pyruvyl transferase n=1 Tax=Rarobacter faecitabidus TaxID=13243 RepID=A0A542ZU68_RARFA|nr:polysaccharide pyruvyl transferase family protein [Rarobacter faecitabidus]TQL63901.1 polysaccharide pyruvyl transferase [Rarobacter faecitabidus]
MSQTRIALRGFRDPFKPVQAAQTYKRNLIGQNVGNLVFLQAAHRLLMRDDYDIRLTLKMRDASDAAWLDRNADHLVVPLANAFRPAFANRLEEMAQCIRKLKIPVTVLGVGAQATVSGKTSKIDPMSREVKSFVSAVLDHGPTIGVRGEFTRDYLISLGFSDSDVEVIGCPSIFHYGPDLPELRIPSAPFTSETPLAVNISPYVHSMGPILRSNQEHYRDLTYFGQDLHTLGLLLGGEYRGTGKHPDLPLTHDHPMLAGDQTVFCLDPRVWYEELAKREFSFGTRIHGNIAALLAGTPAVVLAHDSRTLELARYFDIPFAKIQKLDPGTLAQELFANADYTQYSAGHAERWNRFTTYMNAHGLKHAYQPGGTAEEFDAKIAAADFAPPVRLTEQALRKPISTQTSMERRAERKARLAELASRGANGEPADTPAASNRKPSIVARIRRKLAK